MASYPLISPLAPADGGWVALMISAIISSLMLTWWWVHALRLPAWHVHICWRFDHPLPCNMPAARLRLSSSSLAPRHTPPIHWPARLLCRYGTTRKMRYLSKNQVRTTDFLVGPSSSTPPALVPAVRADVFASCVPSAVTRGKHSSISHPTIAVQTAGATSFSKQQHQHPPPPIPAPPLQCEQEADEFFKQQDDMLVEVLGGDAKVPAGEGDGAGAEASKPSGAPSLKRAPTLGPTFHYARAIMHEGKQVALKPLVLKRNGQPLARWEGWLPRVVGATLDGRGMSAIHSSVPSASLLPPSGLPPASQPPPLPPLTGCPALALCTASRCRGCPLCWSTCWTRCPPCMRPPSS